MERGLLELWKLIVEENVKVIIALNESFSRRKNCWYDIFMYFPDDHETEYKIHDVFTLKLKKVVKGD